MPMNVTQNSELPPLTVEVTSVRIVDGMRQATRVPVVRELPFTVILNGREVLTTLCSPASLDFLVAGVLFSEGFIKSRADITSLAVDAEKGIAQVTSCTQSEPHGQALRPLIASGGGKGASGYNPALASARVDSKLTITSGEVLALIEAFLKSSDVYAATHGVHNAAFCRPEGIIFFQEDIGRHNALDKVFGAALLQDIPTSDAIIITSGRISSEILLKVAKRGVPILISKASPTDLGVSLAARLNITLIRATPKSGLLIFNGAERVVDNSK